MHSNIYTTDAKYLLIHVSALHVGGNILYLMCIHTSICQVLISTQCTIHTMLKLYSLYLSPVSDLSMFKFAKRKLRKVYRIKKQN